MNAKKIFLIVVAVIIVGFIIVSMKALRITKIVDGSTVELSNGALVSLIGIEQSKESYDQLTSYLNEKVEVIPDGSHMFDVKGMERGTKYPAYLYLKSGACINGELLKTGAAKLHEGYPLKDKLQEFQNLAMEGARRGVIPTPAPKQVIDYSQDSIILPPYQPGERRESAWWSDGEENLAMLEDACDFNLPYTKKFANELAARSAGPFNIGQVCEIFDYCYNKWRYVNDPADKEYVARASESIASSLTGDCDDFAVLMASCILAVGGRPCINTGHNATGGHAFAEVDIANFDQNEVLNAIKRNFTAYNIISLNTRRDGEHVWLNLDWQAAYPGGPYYDCSKSWDSYPYENGRWHWKKLN